jgi:hypothetical protein
VGIPLSGPIATGHPSVVVTDHDVLRRYPVSRSLLNLAMRIAQDNPDSTLALEFLLTVLVDALRDLKTAQC